MPVNRAIKELHKKHNKFKRELTDAERLVKLGSEMGFDMSKQKIEIGGLKDQARKMGTALKADLEAHKEAD